MLARPAIKKMQLCCHVLHALTGDLEGDLITAWWAKTSPIVSRHVQSSLEKCTHWQLAQREQIQNRCRDVSPMTRSITTFRFVGHFGRQRRQSQGCPCTWKDSTRAWRKIDVVAVLASKFCGVQHVNTFTRSDLALVKLKTIVSPRSRRRQVVDCSAAADRGTLITRVRNLGR